MNIWLIPKIKKFIDIIENFLRPTNAGSNGYRNSYLAVKPFRWAVVLPIPTDNRQRLKRDNPQVFHQASNVRFKDSLGYIQFLE
jgi:hypothetical protein